MEVSPKRGCVVSVNSGADSPRGRERVSRTVGGRTLPGGGRLSTLRACAPPVVRSVRSFIRPGGAGRSAAERAPISRSRAPSAAR
ncbi:hypothetical protein FRAHR75_110014 [Frankia sp. Hr75.2]|nr:hypothetical protein FRAHR75_110014 [Frankia sp. Hr75.2]